MIRFIFVKEVRRTSSEKKESIPVGRLIYLLFHNKYILLVAGVTLVANIITSLSVGTYFNKYIYHDIGIGSLMSLTMVSIILAVALVPMISRRIGLRRTLQIFMALGMAGYLIRLINIPSVPLGFVSQLLAMLAATVPIGFIAPLAIDCMDYGEWKNKQRSEGIISSATSITTKLGGALGVWVTGTLMGLSGYNGELAEQSASAVNMIIALSTIIPAVMTLVMIILLQFYDLDKFVDKIRAELRQGTEVIEGEKE